MRFTIFQLSGLLKLFINPKLIKISHSVNLSYVRRSETNTIEPIINDMVSHKTRSIAQLQIYRVHACCEPDKLLLHKYDSPSLISALIYAMLCFFCCLVMM